MTAFLTSGAARLRELDERLLSLARTRLSAPNAVAPLYEFSTLAASAGVLAAMLAEHRYMRMLSEVVHALDAAERGQSLATYSVDDERPCSLEELLLVNADAPLSVVVLSCVVGLMPGEAVSLDYGAGGVRTLRRVT